QAIDKDPVYAPAYVGLADAYYLLSNIYMSPHEAMPKSKAAAMRALQIDPALPEAYSALAVVKSEYDWDWTGAERAYKQALALNPSYAWAHTMYGLFLRDLGKLQDARAEMNRAQELDPLSIYAAVGAVSPLYSAPPSERHMDQAIEEFRKILRGDPTSLAA